MTAPLRVAVLGAGTVGREVIRAFLDAPDRLRSAGAGPLTLAGVAVRDLRKAADQGIPEALLTDAPAHLVAGPDTDVVVELMGGDEPARTLIEAALTAGKAVVTANKHVLAHHGPGLEATARRTGAALRFEASVGGGTPVLRPLAEDLAVTRVGTVRGIVNGTTNYILTAMAEDGRDYAEVLAAAQAAGYAEADPTADVEAHDAVNKLVILARLAYGAWLSPADIPNRNGAGLPGITGVTRADLAAATEAGFTIKLIAEAARSDGQPDTVAASVSCTALSQWSELAWIGGVTNGIEIDTDPLGRVAFIGPGAGGAATASAVLADLTAIARGAGSTWAGLPEAGRGRVAPVVRAETFIGPSGASYPVIR